VARSISAYLHSKHHENSWELTGRTIEEDKMSLAEFVEANWFDKAHNFQTKMLLGPEFASNTAPKSGAEITAAIRPPFHLIGYTEALEFIPLLSAHHRRFPAGVVQ
jgi:hypothetical protein